MRSTPTVSARSEDRHAGCCTTRTGLSCVLVAVLALLAAGCSAKSKQETAPAPFRSAVRSPPPALLPAGRLVLARRRCALGPVALDGNSLVWESSPVEGAAIVPAVLQKDLTTGKVTRIDSGVDPQFGLAAASGWAVFARSGPAGRQLLARRYDASRTIVLTKSLATPIASRGTLVAWGEQSGKRQRVVVRDLARSEDWVAADVSTCESAGCYRIDGVTLANRGVAFARGAIGQHASIVGLRAFADREPTQVRIGGDPQPDLVPSSAGALFYRFARGWYRWDFGGQPRRTRFAGSTPAPLLGYERGRWFLAPPQGCKLQVTALSSGGRRLAVVSPAELGRFAGVGDRGQCIELHGFAWTGRQALSAWVLVPKESEENGEEEDATSIIVSSRLLDQD